MRFCISRLNDAESMCIPQKKQRKSAYISNVIDMQAIYHGNDHENTDVIGETILLISVIALSVYVENAIRPEERSM